MGCVVAKTKNSSLCSDIIWDGFPQTAARLMTPTAVSIAVGAFTRTQVVDFCLPANEQADFNRD
jgi:hypothetical protein